MREIECRGYDQDTKRWYYGSYVRLNRSTPYPMAQDPEAEKAKFEAEQVDHYIFFTLDNDWGLETRKLRATVDPKSVGQYTGTWDKKHKRIYEGDVLQYILPPEHGVDDRPDLYVVEWATYGFEARWINPQSPTAKNDGHLSMRGTDEDMVIIGNIYDNPDLLERES